MWHYLSPAVLVTINDNYSNILTAISTILLVSVTFIYVRTVQKQVTITYDDLEYQKLVQEMTYLIGPLFSKKDDIALFGDTELEFRPHRGKVDWYMRWGLYYDFWDSIKTHMHLSTPEVVLALENYFNARQKYWKARGDSLVVNLEKTSENIQIIKEFEEKRSELNFQIYRRHKKLMEELKIKRRK